ncbi:MAG: hypothetical protein ACJ8AK_02900 [Gemmatimonadaceae bacterium]
MNAEKLEQLGKVHEEIGSTLWPHGAILKCVVCRHQERITAQQAASCLRNGWPSHCDRTMSCERALVPAEERYELTAKGRAALHVDDDPA